MLRGARSKWDTSTGHGWSELSTTALGIIKGGGGFRDPYEAGTARERAYIRSIKIDRLGSAVVNELDTEVFIDIDDDEDEYAAREEFVNIVPNEVEDPKTQELST